MIVTEAFHTGSEIQDVMLKRKKGDQLGKTDCKVTSED